LSFNRNKSTQDSEEVLARDLGVEAAREKQIREELTILEESVKQNEKDIRNLRAEMASLSIKFNETSFFQRKLSGIVFPLTAFFPTKVLVKHSNMTGVERRFLD
jgi:hypothetical protein